MVYILQIIKQDTNKLFAKIIPTLYVVESHLLRFYGYFYMVS